MTKAELVEKAAKDANISKVAAAAALSSFMDGVTKALKKKQPAPKPPSTPTRQTVNRTPSSIPTERISSIPTLPPTGCKRSPTRSPPAES